MAAFVDREKKREWPLQYRPRAKERQACNANKSTQAPWLRRRRQSIGPTNRGRAGSHDKKRRPFGCLRKRSLVLPLPIGKKTAARIGINNGPNASTEAGAERARTMRAELGREINQTVRLRSLILQQLVGCSMRLNRQRAEFTD
jgi:hypothetical protein